MSRKITTIKEHKAAIKRGVADNLRRLEHDVEDVALSSWATDSMNGFHRFAIKTLEAGKELGIDGPAWDRLFLWDTKSDRAIDAKCLGGKFGFFWLLSDSEAARFGRKTMPSSSNSRILKKNNLTERLITIPCKRWAKAHCSFVGGPTSFSAEFEDAEIAKITKGVTA